MTGQLRANWIRQIRSRVGGTISLLVLAFGGGVLALALAAEWAGLRLNDSPSMPIGLYVRTSCESRSSLAVFCPEEPTARLSAERGYRKPRKLPGWRRAPGRTDSGSPGRHRGALGNGNGSEQPAAAEYLASGDGCCRAAPVPLAFRKVCCRARHGMGGKFLQLPEF
jgi:hypothetical protein